MKKGKLQKDGTSPELEHWVTHKLVEKNNRIRLAAAKKTIEKLEGKNSNVLTEGNTNA